MSWIRALPLALALVVTPALLPRTGRAEDRASEERSPLDAAIDRVAAEPRTDEVLSVTQFVRQEGDTEAVLRLVGALRARRGYASSRALGSLASHPDPRVREAVLYAIADIGLRVAEGMRDVRAARTDAGSDVRAAAYAALTAVGDVTDVPALLDDLASADKEVVRGAADALRGISGATLRGGVRLWRQWWKETQEFAVTRLNEAWDLLEKGGDAQEIARAGALVDRTAWLDLPGAARRAEAWLESNDPRLRAIAYRVAGKLRLGDLAEPVRLACDVESREENRAAARESAATLLGDVAANAAHAAAGAAKR